MTTPQPSIDDILARKRRSVAQKQVVTPLRSLRALSKMQSRPIDVSSTIKMKSPALLARIINPAAVKLADSASDAPYDPVMIARQLVRRGAQGLVVSTDELYHGGDVSHLTLIAKAVDVPVIRSDYILEEYQVVETRAAGADGLIIHPRLLEPDQIRRLVSATQRNLMTTIAQVHSVEELEMVLSYEPRIIAIDNRMAYSGELDHDTTNRIMEKVPGHITVIAMGGLKTLRDVSRVMAGADGVLVNQSMLLNDDYVDALQILLGIDFDDNPVSHDDTSDSGVFLL